MAPALPFPAHKHPPSTVGALGIMNAIPGGLPADQGESAPIEEAAAGVEGAPPTEGTPGEPTDDAPDSTPETASPDMGI